MSRAPDRAVVGVFFALGDETRLSVVRRLGGGVALSATTLSDGAQVTRQAIVKHLQVLEEAGLVTHEKQGREVLYVLESRRFAEAQAFLEGASAGWDRAIDRLRGMVEDTMKPMSKSATIDGYLAGVEPGRRAALQKLRKTIRLIVPEAEECISYSLPAFRVDGRVVAGFAATKRGCSYFPFSGRTLETLADDLRGYDMTKSSLHFDPAKGLPKALLRKLLRARIAERR